MHLETHSVCVVVFMSCKFSNRSSDFLHRKLKNIIVDRHFNNLPETTGITNEK